MSHLIEGDESLFLKTGFRLVGAEREMAQNWIRNKSGRQARAVDGVTQKLIKLTLIGVDQTVDQGQKDRMDLQHHSNNRDNHNRPDGLNPTLEPEPDGGTDFN